MADYLWLFILLALILLVSAGWALWSLKDLSVPANLYPRVKREVRKALAGVIHLPKRG